MKYAKCDMCGAVIEDGQNKRDTWETVAIYSVPQKRQVKWGVIVTIKDMEAGSQDTADICAECLKAIVLIRFGLTKDEA